MAENSSEIFFQRPDAFLTPIPNAPDIIIDTGDTTITIPSMNEQIRQELRKYEIPQECYNNIENEVINSENQHVQLQVENYCIYGVLEGTVTLFIKMRRATLIGENVPAKSVKVKILKKGDIFFAPSMIIYLLSEKTALNNGLWLEYDQETIITKYNYSNFQNHFRDNHATWLPAIKAIMNRTWDAVVAPLSDHPKIPEFQTILPKKQYRRNDFLFGMSNEIYAEQVDGITPNGFAIFNNPEYNHSFDEKNPIILNENDEPHLVFVKEGTVKAVKKLQNTSNGVKEIVVTREANQLLGAFELFTEENSYFTIKSSLVMVPLPSEGGTIAAPLTKVVKIPKREIPLKLWLWLALNTLKNLTPIVQMMDFLIDLVFIEPGRTLYKKGIDKPNEIYVVIDGQFRMQYENKKGLKKIKEYHRGNKMGTKETFLEKKPTYREHTLFATRPSVVARFHIDLYNNLIYDFGGRREAKKDTKPNGSVTAVQTLMEQQYFSEIYTIRQMKYRKTIAILPASKSVNISDFVSELVIYTNAYIRGEHNRHL
uniref:Cyclic nucleotide-binding domain-containing protein n=1 Tax=Acrobeloides nanus TaxID=290746 RepID=A0A914DKL4_9BILA